MTDKQKLEIKLRFSERAMTDAVKRHEDKNAEVAKLHGELSNKQEEWNRERERLSAALLTLESERAGLRLEMDVAREGHEEAKRQHAHELAKEEARAKGLKVS